jgi:hypothetical protein
VTTGPATLCPFRCNPLHLLRRQWALPGAFAPLCTAGKDVAPRKQTGGLRGVRLSPFPPEMTVSISKCVPAHEFIYILHIYNICNKCIDIGEI